MSQLTICFNLMLLSAFFLTSCTGDRHADRGSAPVTENYEQTIADWKEYRVNVLKGPTNWLRLHNIYWLNEGENSFGSGSDVDIRFPDGSIDENAGIFTLRDGQVFMQVNEPVTITHEGEPVSDFLLFDGENRLHAEHKQLEWFVDSRGDQHGIRLYNKDNPAADAFTGFPFFPLQPEWHLHAEFIPNNEQTTITVDNVLGEQIDRVSPGNIRFSIDVNLFDVIAFEANSGLFIMFSDHTSGEETYHAGRYMIIPFPDENNQTLIDFNRAYNPPCAFHTLTTCQLPPLQNRLDVAITAGEKTPVEWTGL